MIESDWSIARDRLVGDGLKLLETGRVGSPALEHEPRPRQRRAQIMGDVVADAGERMDHRLHLIEHAVDDDCEAGKTVRRHCGTAAARAGRPAMMRRTR